MDHYLISVFQNQSLSAVRTMCEQGKQKLSLRNDTLRWAIQQHENELVNLLIHYTDVHHDGAMPVRLAAWADNTHALEKILAVPDAGSSANDRFEVFIDLINNPHVSPTVLEMISNSFSDEVLHQLHAKSGKRIQWYMELAYDEAAAIPQPAIPNNEYHRQAMRLQSSLDKITQLRSSSKKPKV